VPTLQRVIRGARGGVGAPTIAAHHPNFEVPRTPFSLCFGVPIVEALKIFAVCRASASAQKTLQKTGTMLIHEKSADQPKNALIRRFFEISVFPVFSDVVCARLQTLGKQLKFRLTQNSGPGNRGEMASGSKEGGAIGPPIGGVPYTMGNKNSHIVFYSTGSPIFFLPHWNPMRGRA